MPLNLSTLQSGPRSLSFFINLSFSICVFVAAIVMFVFVVSGKTSTDVQKFYSAGMILGVVLIALALRAGFNQVAFHVGKSA